MSLRLNFDFGDEFITQQSYESEQIENKLQEKNKNDKNNKDMKEHFYWSFDR